MVETGYCPLCRESASVIEEMDYHYTESGLPNVYLSNGILDIECENCDETYVSVPREGELLQTIGLTLLKSLKPMTGPELKFLRREIRLKQKDLASRVSSGGRQPTISEWESEEGRIFKRDRIAEEFYLRLMLMDQFSKSVERNEDDRFISLQQYEEFREFMKQISNYRDHFRISWDRPWKDDDESKKNSKLTFLVDREHDRDNIWHFRADPDWDYPIFHV